MKAVYCGTLIDGTRRDPVENGVILVEDGTVRSVGPETEIDVPTDADEVRYGDSVVVPGLIDAHVHLDGWREHDPMAWILDDVSLATARATADLRRLVENGFTTVRDVGSRTGLGLKQAHEEGRIAGPRVYTSERLLSQTAGHGDIHFLPHEWVADNPNWIGILADGADEFRRETRKLVRKGVDCVKIMTTGGVLSEKDSPYHHHMTDAEIQAVVEEAHRVGVPVASHAEGPAGIESALRNGVDTIEHGFGVDDSLVEMMLDREAILVPTLAVMEKYLERGHQVNVPEYAMEKIEGIKEQHIPAVQTAHDADIPIALGTDFSGSQLAPHGDNALEAELLVNEVGMDEFDVLQSATVVAARTIPDDQLGAIEPGKYGDFVVLNSNPLEDISNLRDISAVYQGGEEVAV